LEPRNDEKSPEEAQKGAIFPGDCEPPTPACGSRAGESVGRGGKIDGNGESELWHKRRPSFGGAVLAFAALGLARDKRGIAVELKGKREDDEEILQKRVERVICEGGRRRVNCCYCLCNDNGGGMGSAVV
jgi:hypothetical protein